MLYNLKKKSPIFFCWILRVFIISAPCALHFSMEYKTSETRTYGGHIEFSGWIANWESKYYMAWPMYRPNSMLVLAILDVYCYMRYIWWLLWTLDSNHHFFGCSKREYRLHRIDCQCNISHTAWGMLGAGCKCLVDGRK